MKKLISKIWRLWNDLLREDSPYSMSRFALIHSIWIGTFLLGAYSLACFISDTLKFESTTAVGLWVGITGIQGALKLIQKPMESKNK